MLNEAKKLLTISVGWVEDYNDPIANAIKKTNAALDKVIANAEKMAEGKSVRWWKLPERYGHRRFAKLDGGQLFFCGDGPTSAVRPAPDFMSFETIEGVEKIAARNGWVEITGDTEPKEAVPFLSGFSIVKNESLPLQAVGECREIWMPMTAELLAGIRPGDVVRVRNSNPEKTFVIGEVVSPGLIKAANAKPGQYLNLHPDADLNIWEIKATPRIGAKAVSGTIIKKFDFSKEFAGQSIVPKTIGFWLPMTMERKKALKIGDVVRYMKNHEHDIVAINHCGCVPATGGILSICDDPGYNNLDKWEVRAAPEHLKGSAAAAASVDGLKIHSPFFDCSLEIPFDHVNPDDEFAPFKITQPVRGHFVISLGKDVFTERPTMEEARHYAKIMQRVWRVREAEVVKHRDKTEAAYRSREEYYNSIRKTLDEMGAPNIPSGLILQGRIRALANTVARAKDAIENRKWFTAEIHRCLTEAGAPDHEVSASGMCKPLTPQQRIATFKWLREKGAENYELWFALSRAVDQALKATNINCEENTKARIAALDELVGEINKARASCGAAAGFVNLCAELETILELPGNLANSGWRTAAERVKQLVAFHKAHQKPKKRRKVKRK